MSKLTEDEQSKTMATGITDRLMAHRQKFHIPAGLSFRRVGHLTNHIIGTLFPHFDGHTQRPIKTEDDLNAELKTIEDELVALINLVDGGLSASLVAQRTIAELPAIAEAMLEDAEALYKNDPAAYSLDEVIYSYPGFYAVAAYRIAHSLLTRGVPLLPRMMGEYAHQQTGIEIHPGAKIGRRFFIDHGTGVVIGATAVIGDSVKLYQGVTIGALRIDRTDSETKRHPTIEDNVVIYANATILGGETVVGQNCIIGGNVWLTRSVPANSRVMFRSCNTEDIISIESRKKA